MWSTIQEIRAVANTHYIIKLGKKGNNDQNEENQRKTNLKGRGHLETLHGRRGRTPQIK